MFTHVSRKRSLNIITFTFGHGPYISHIEYSLVKGLIDNISKWKGVRLLKTRKVIIDQIIRGLFYC